MLGFDALGRQALGQGNLNEIVAGVAQASGTGRAGSLSGSVAVGITQAAGAGVARALTASPAASLTGVTGTGVARALAETIDKTLPPVTGTGTAGAIAGTPAGNFTGASGTGVAGQITVAVSGGGVSRKPKTGLEPVRKRYTRAEPEVVAKPALPPFTAKRQRTSETTPLEVVDRTGFSLTSVSEQIEAARQRGHEQNDADDIADVLAGLEVHRPVSVTKPSPPIAPAVDMTAQDADDIAALLRDLDDQDHDADDMADVLALLD